VELWVQLDESYKMNFGVELGDYIVKCDDDIYVFKEEDFYEEFWVVSTAGDIPF
jgi:hypothetical protein